MLRNIAKSLLAAAAFLAWAAAQPASAQKQVLHMAYWAGPSHQMVQTLAAWIKTIEEASGGNLTVEVDKAALGKMEGQYDLIRNGVRDLGWAVPGYTVGRFEMLQAAEQNLGLALVRELLAADALADGRLVRLSPLSIIS